MSILSAYSMTYLQRQLISCFQHNSTISSIATKMSDKKPFLARQPGQAIWTAFTVLSCLFHLPFLLLLYIPKASRPRPDWSYRQALANEISKLFFNYASIVELQTPRSLEPGPDKDRFVIMHPVKGDT